MTESKEVRVIRAKIATKENQIEENGMFGPIVVATIGIGIFIFAVYPIEGIRTLWEIAIAGLIICGISLWWCKYREDKITMLKYEIAELEAELDE